MMMMMIEGKAKYNAIIVAFKVNEDIGTPSGLIR